MIISSFSSFHLYILYFISILLIVKAEEFYIDCGPDGIGEIGCHERACTWKSPPKGNPQNFPYCSRPRRSAYVTDLQGSPNILLKFNNVQNGFQNGEKYLNESWRAIEDTLQIIISSPQSYKPSISIPRKGISSTEKLEYMSASVVGTSDYAFIIRRKSTGNIIFDTSFGGFFYSPQFIEISSFLPSRNIYGLGEHKSKTLRHDTSVYTAYTMMNDPKIDPKKPTKNLFGTHPFYLCLEKDGKAHGVLFFNSAPQEVVLGPILTYRTISGQLEMAFFPGPTPEEVIRQYHSYIGLPTLQPYWAFGFQYGETATTYQSLQTSLSKIMNFTNHLDVMNVNHEYQDDFTSFTINKNWNGLPSYVQKLKNQNIKTSLEFDPVLPANSQQLKEAISKDATLVTWPDSTKPPKINDKYPTTKGTPTMLGGGFSKEAVAFIDFLDPLGRTQQWWGNEIENFHKKIDFDGITLNRNEPLNMGKVLECPKKNDLDTPPYKLQEYSGTNAISELSLCMEGRTSRTFSTFYDTRNLYGISQSIATHKAFKSNLNKRPMVISRSTFVSSGSYGGHWLDGNTATWDDLLSSITGVLAFNMFGIPFVGSDICGSSGAFTEDLCRRWFQLGSFHSLSRFNHDVKSEGRKNIFIYDSIQKAASSSLTTKYKYLPYLYNLHYNVARFGGTVMRPLFFEYPADLQSIEIDYQFFWGSAIMVVPITEAGAKTVRTYFPLGSWYYAFGNRYGIAVDSVYYQDILIANDTLPHFYKGGHIIATHSEASLTLTETRLTPLSLKVAVLLNNTSSGSLYWDSGDDVITDIESHPSLQWDLTFGYNSTSGYLTGTPKSGNSNSISIPPINIIEFFGYPYFPYFNSFKLNGTQIFVNTQKTTYSPFTKIFHLQSLNLITLKSFVSNSFSLTWTHS